MSVDLAPEVVEAAACAYLEPPAGEPTDRWHYRAIEAAIRAADEARGLRVDDYDGHNEWYRLVSDWLPKGPTA